MQVEPGWLAPGAKLELAGHEVHVWRAVLPESVEQILALARSLDAKEQARANRFARPRDRDRYLAWHGVLRGVMARYLQVDPAMVRYELGRNGKPRLAAESEPSDICFNLTHSGSLALIAVAQGREVGIDVEILRPMPDAVQIARRYFSADELVALSSLPPEEQVATFFNIWTRKEAFVKATGQGLAYPLSQLNVGLTSDPPARATWRTIEDTQPRGTWSLCTLWPAAGYVAALVVEGLGCEVRRWDWRPQ
jgi:4'-phosphopantetheinyl transferase